MILRPLRLLSLLAAASLAACASAPSGSGRLGPGGKASRRSVAPDRGVMAPIPNPVAPAPRPEPEPERVARPPREPARPAQTPAPSPVRSPPPSSPPPAAAEARPGRDPARARRLRLAGLEQLNRGAVDRAVALLQQAAQLDPDSALVRRDLERARRIGQAVRRRP